MPARPASATIAPSTKVRNGRGPPRPTPPPAPSASRRPALKQATRDQVRPSLPVDMTGWFQTHFGTFRRLRRVGGAQPRSTSARAHSGIWPGRLFTIRRHLRARRSSGRRCSSSVYLSSCPAPTERDPGDNSHALRPPASRAADGVRTWHEKLATAALPHMLALAAIALILWAGGGCGGSKDGRPTGRAAQRLRLTEGATSRSPGTAGRSRKIAGRPQATHGASHGRDSSGGQKLHADADASRAAVADRRVLRDIATPGKSRSRTTPMAPASPSPVHARRPAGPSSTTAARAQRQRLTCSSTSRRRARRPRRRCTTRFGGRAALRRPGRTSCRSRAAEGQLADATHFCPSFLETPTRGFSGLACDGAARRSRNFVKQAGEPRVTASRSAQLRPDSSVCQRPDELRSTDDCTRPVRHSTDAAARRLGQVADPIDQSSASRPGSRRRRKPGVKALAKSSDKGASKAQAALTTTQQLNADEGLQALSTPCASS